MNSRNFFLILTLLNHDHTYKSLFKLKKKKEIKKKNIKLLKLKNIEKKFNL